jgi:hypothetical protein
LLYHSFRVESESNDARTPLTATFSNGRLNVTSDLEMNGGGLHIDEGVSEQHYWQHLIVVSWKFPFNS